MKLGDSLSTRRRDTANKFGRARSDVVCGEPLFVAAEGPHGALLRDGVRSSGSSYSARFNVLFGIEPSSVPSSHLKGLGLVPGASSPTPDILKAPEKLETNIDS